MQHLVLQKALNHLLATQGVDITTLEDTLCRFVVQGLPFADFELYLLCRNQRFVVLSTTQPPVDIDIKLKPEVFLNLLKGEDLTELLRQDKIHIHGDVKKVQLLVDLLKHVNIDLEELLSQYTGDIVAHQAGRLFTKLRSTFNDNPVETDKERLSTWLIKPSIH